MATDFSSLHDCVSDLFPQPKNKDEWDQYRLTDDQVKFFQEHGYLSGVRLLNENQIEHLRTELAEFFNTSHEGSELWYEYHTNESSDQSRVLFHALGAWRLRQGFHDMLWNPAFVVPASQLLEGSVRFWHDQLFCKPAKHGGNVAWHQDYSYWTRTKPMAHLTCWIGLDPATQANGCLQYIPGSHEWDLLPTTELAGDMDGIEKLLNEKQFEQFQNPVPVELDAGQCSFHHPLMVHGSFSNSTEIPRRATVINVIRDGVESYTDETLLNGVPIIKKGQKMDGQFFPLLYNAAT